MADCNDAIRLDWNIANDYNNGGTAYADKKDYDRSAIADMATTKTSKAK